MSDTTITTDFDGRPSETTVYHADIETETVSPVPATNGDTGPDVDAWFKAQRAELATEERQLAKAKADLDKALAKADQARAAIRIYTGFIEGRSRGIAHTEKLLAKGDGK